MSGSTPDGWSAYDEAVPHTAGLPLVAARAAELRALRPSPAQASLADVRRVVVVVSSSRGGSTLTGEVLRRVPGLLHLRAEINPLFTLAGLHAGTERRRVLEEELLRDIGTPLGAAQIGPDDHARLALDVVWRLTVQWPDLASAPLEQLLGVATAAMPADGRAADSATTLVRVLRKLRAAGHPVHPCYYDLPASSGDASAGDEPPCQGPPSSAVVEMPPFVVAEPWRPASEEQLRTMPLVLCTPRNAFRLEFLRDLFPAAEMHVVHLTRNPAASVNGLMDGWLHHGFYNCPVPGGLAVDGYSDAVTAAGDWWCFDFPPAWQDLRAAPLERVCAAQWRSAHTAALEACARLGIEPARVAFEDVVGSSHARERAAAALARALGVPLADVAAPLRADLPVVMATADPQPGRWRRRAHLIEDVLADPDVRETAQALGYDEHSRWS